MDKIETTPIAEKINSVHYNIITEAKQKLENLITPFTDELLKKYKEFIGKYFCRKQGGSNAQWTFYGKVLDVEITNKLQSSWIVELKNTLIISYEDKKGQVKKFKADLNDTYTELFFGETEEELKLFKEVER